MAIRDRIKYCIVGFLLVSLLPGCALQNANIKGENIDVRNSEVPSALDEYKLQVGDRISLVGIVNEQFRTSSAYRIRSGDLVSVVVQDRPDLSMKYRVGPDGKITLMQIGELNVLGLTPDELRTAVNGRYRKAEVTDFITVELSEFDLAAANFIRDLTAGMNGREPFATTLSIDGRANFPLIGFVRLVDFTLEDANELIRQKYKEHFHTLDVTLRIEQSSAHNITVLGEVLRPGAYPINGTLSILSALGASGGYTTAAKTDSIMIVQRRGDKVYVNKFNLAEDMFAMSNHKLIAGDFIYVPMSTIANVNQFVDQFLRRNLPIGVNVNGVYQVK
jgi:protein involved in polysaccharide export with SLBB domain